MRRTESQVVEIRSLKQFRTWLRDYGKIGAWFGRIGFNQRSLLVGRNRTLKFHWDQFTPDELPMYPLTLPPTSPATEVSAWWRGTIDQRITKFFRHQKMSAYAIVRVGTWRALPEWCVLRSKREWTAITAEQCEADIGRRLFHAMVHEHDFLGVSVRNLPKPQKLRRGCESGKKVKRR